MNPSDIPLPPLPQELHQGSPPRAEAREQDEEVVMDTSGHQHTSQRDLYSDDQHTWDVVDLWEAASHYTPTEIPLTEVADLDRLLDSHCWSDGPLSVREILEHGDRVRDADLSYPIILTPKGCIADGCHRLVKALRTGQETILAVRLTSMPEPLPKN